MYCPTSGVLCEKEGESTHLLYSSVFLLLKIERQRKKERKAGGGEGENIYKLGIKQINLLFISFDGVGLCVQRILIIYKNQPSLIYVETLIRVTSPFFKL